jgi:hypothetical protein
LEIKMADEEIVERCAAICDSVAQELEALKPNARQFRYDRQSLREIDYAIRAVHRAAERIRALRGNRPNQLE